MSKRRSEEKSKERRNEAESKETRSEQEIMKTRGYKEVVITLQVVDGGLPYGNKDLGGLWSYTSVCDDESAPDAAGRVAESIKTSILSVLLVSGGNVGVLVQAIR